MYCPCCGFKNRDSVSYCRSCGADSQTLLETLESDVPIAAAAKLLLSRLEDRFARRTEYFRLQTISVLSWFLAIALYQTYPHNPHLSIFPLSTPIFVGVVLLFLYSFAESFLKYKRSKVFYAKTKAKARLRTSLFCPHCGTESSLDASYCRSCGQDLDAVARALGSSPSRLSKLLDDQIARAERRFSRWSSGRLIALTIAGIFSMTLTAVVALRDTDNWVEALHNILFCLPACLIYVQLLVARRRERALWNPDIANRHTSRILEWLSANHASFEEQGVTEELLMGAIDGLRREETDAALDLLENREIVVRLPDKQAAESILVKPGRGWPQARATIGLPSSQQPASSATQPMQILDDPSVKTTGPLPNRTAKFEE